ncbi:DUF1203 domain-containing protein [Massilia sp. DD77]|uniref:DUF1203 domain-containing protein n=1 Tax=Massilia sp. DD77 TaxID=3109349 RepID=UPI002FFF25FA
MHHHPVPSTPIRIVPLPSSYLQRARAGIDDLGQPVERHTAQGGEPLRDLLRRAEPGEPILLASYCPFTQAGPFREYGPVFLSAAGQGAAQSDTLPVQGKAPYLGASFVLRAYSERERIVDARVSSPHAAAADLDALFARADTDFVLARFTAYGCYALRVERAMPGGAGIALRR